jgi:putative ABC transport system permease protein
MHFFPILSTLRRHRTTALLIVAEIALSCAIVCNAVFLIRQRLAHMDRDTGMAEDELVRVQLTGIGTKSDAEAITYQDLVALRAIPGVKSVAVANMVPYGNSSSNTSVSTIADDANPPIESAAMYAGSIDLVATFGVRLIAGRGFTADDFAPPDAVRTGNAKIASVIVTRGVAEQLYPGQNAVGKPVYSWGKDPQTIVGVIEHLARPNEVGSETEARWAIVLPVGDPYTSAGNYVLRADPARRAEVLAAVDGVLARIDPGRILLARDTVTDMRARYYRQDRAMAWLLTAVTLTLLVVTALGIVGLASFWVQQRTRQIGVRRALGATRGDILRYFQTENFILATLGIIAGMVLAYALNLVLMKSYQITRLPAAYLPIGAAMLWGLGQIAVLGPALRASLIPPATATRSV